MAAVLFSDDFNDGTADGWSVVDEGTVSAPSAWSVVSGVYRESSNIWGTASGDSNRLYDEFYGTYSYRPGLSWGDFSVTAHLRSDDNDQIGLLFRYQDNGNYYRFFMDNERSVRRLEKRVGGVFTTLAEDFVAYQVGRWYTVQAVVTGTTIRIYVDGVQILQASDSSLTTGTIGLYSWGNYSAKFDDIEVTSLVADTTPPLWDGASGICSARDAEQGGTVTIEFGSATDGVDGSNVRYNVYYAPSSSWDGSNWSNNAVVSAVSPSAGSTCANGYTLSGLQDGVEYTFGVRVADQSGNEDSNTVTAVAVPTGVAADTTPPLWDGGSGICSARDAEQGGTVTIEFGSATDGVDGSNVRYNVYYAPSSSWDGSNWSNNAVVSAVNPSAGSTCANGYTLSGLQNGVEYTFGVRVADQSGNEDSNTVTAVAVPTGTATSSFSDDFNDGTADGWSVVDEGTVSAPSAWSVVSGVYRETSNIWGTASGDSNRLYDEFYGTYSYRPGLSWGDFSVTAHLRSDDNDQIGLLFRYQDNGNYYRFFMDNERSVRRLEKRVGGVFTTLAEDFVAYQIGRWYTVQAVVTGTTIRIYVDGVQILQASDSSLATGTIGLYSWGNYSAKFDDIEVTSLVADTTPPEWDGDSGICSAHDSEEGGRVTVEFGSATDGVDGSNVRYNVYYAPSSSWDGSNWSNNAVVSAVSPSAGSTCAYSYTLSGLQNGVEYTFGVRVADQSGNEDSNDQTATAVPTLTIDFAAGGLQDWTATDNTTTAGNWYVQDGILKQDVYVPGQTDDGYDIGSYLRLNDFDYGDGEIHVRLRSQGVDCIGVMFRYQNDGTYYRFSMSKRQGYRKLEKRVGGAFTELAGDTVSYQPNVWYDVKIVNVSDRILVYVNDEPILAAVDSDITHGSVALYNSRNDISEYDSISVLSAPSDPMVVVAGPTAFSLTVNTGISIAAVVNNLPTGGGVEFVVDEGTDSAMTLPGMRSYSNPSVFETSADSLAVGNHTLDAYLLDGSGVRLTSGLAHDRNLQIGIGGLYLVGYGDSITDGKGDDDGTDDSSADGRNNCGGYQPPLNDLLTNHLTGGEPVTVIDEGTPGDMSTEGVDKIATVLSRNPDVQYVLILFGTNDSAGSFPLDKAAFKANMQQIVDAVLAAGKIPVLAKLPIVLGPCSTCDPYQDPLGAARNLLIQSYNEAIDELVYENTLPFTPPDFYSYFAANQDQFSDNLHPDGEGYRAMATLWLQSIYP